MRVKCRIAVGAKDAQVLQPMIVTDTVDVIEDETHPTSLPQLALPTELADRLLEAFSQEPSL
jgi:hypothetical protein